MTSGSAAGVKPPTRAMTRCVPASAIVVATAYVPSPWSVTSAWSILSEVESSMLALTAAPPTVSALPIASRQTRIITARSPATARHSSPSKLECSALAAAASTERTKGEPATCAWFSVIARMCGPLCSSGPTRRCARPASRMAVVFSSKTTVLVLLRARMTRTVSTGRSA